MLIFQPPWDLDTRKKFIIHYTYGCDYNMKVKFLLHSYSFRYGNVCLHPFSMVHLFFGKAFVLCFCCTCSEKTLNDQGELTYGKIGEWRFDKRSHLRGPPPRNLPLPPPGVPESVVRV